MPQVVVHVKSQIVVLHVNNICVCVLSPSLRIVSSLLASSQIIVGQIIGQVCNSFLRSKRSISVCLSAREQGKNKTIHSDLSNSNQTHNLVPSGEGIKKKLTIPWTRPKTSWLAISEEKPAVSRYGQVTPFENK